MNKLLASAAVVAMAAACSTVAAYAEASIGISGEVKGECKVPGDHSRDIKLRIDRSNKAEAVRKHKIAEIRNTWCSGPAHINIKTTKGSVNLAGAPGPLGAAPVGFTNFVPYTGDAAWSTVSATISPNNSVAGFNADSAATAGPASDTLTIWYSSPGTTLPLQSGTYSDALVVDVIPN
jgi:hypothetical protein